MVLKKLIPYMLAGALALGVACGKDEHETQKSNKEKIQIKINQEGLEQKVTTTENPCGNSPVHGKHLWEISGCKWGMEMKDDCTVKRSGFKEKVIGRYNGLKIKFYAGFTSKLDPDSMLSSEQRTESGKPLDYNSLRASREKITAVNRILDKYNGYLLLGGTKEWRLDHLDDNAFAPVNAPFPGKAECRESSYYWKNNK